MFDCLFNVLTICFKSWASRPTFKKDFTLILSILKIIIIFNHTFCKIIYLPLPCSGCDKVVVESNLIVSHQPPLFKRIFVCLKAAIIEFLKGCWPFIGLDSCHLKSPFKQTLLLVVSVDTNRLSFLIAYAIVESENYDRKKNQKNCYKNKSTIKKNITERINSTNREKKKTCTKFFLAKQEKLIKKKKLNKNKIKIQKRKRKK